MDKKWTDMIAGAFGLTDRVFAGHPNDVKSAREMLLKAFEEGVGCSQYLGTIQNWLVKNLPADDADNNARASFIKAQMERVCKLTSYFDAE